MSTTNPTFASLANVEMIKKVNAMAKKLDSANYEGYSGVSYNYTTQYATIHNIDGTTQKIKIAEYEDIPSGMTKAEYEAYHENVWHNNKLSIEILKRRLLETEAELNRFRQENEALKKEIEELEDIVTNIPDDKVK
jgi:hypothetical protein